MSIIRGIDFNSFMLVCLFIVNHTWPSDCRSDHGHVRLEKEQALINHRAEFHCSLAIDGAPAPNDDPQPPPPAPPPPPPSPALSAASSSSISVSGSVSASVQAPSSSFTGQDGVMIIYWFKGLETGRPFLAIDARHLFHERPLTSLSATAAVPAASLQQKWAINSTIGKLFGHNQPQPQQNHAIMFKVNNSVDNEFLERVSYRLDLDKQILRLFIDNVTFKDEDIYRCRVDFRHARTRNYYFDFELIVPPSALIIRDQNGTQIPNSNGTAGPYLIGQKLEFICETTLAKPLPKVYWFENGFIADTSYQQVLATSNDTFDPMDSEAKLVKAANHFALFGTLTRQDLGKVLRCSASNTELAEAANLSFRIDMILPPMTVEIVLNSRQKFRVGQQVHIVCRSYGSKPLATLIWTKNNKAALSTEVQELHEKENNDTASLYKFRATVEDDGAVIGCEAMNPCLPSDQTIKDVVIINVQYSPMVELEMVEPSPSPYTLLNKTINNGYGGMVHANTTVKLRCLVKANPSVLVKPIAWYFNNTLIHSSETDSRYLMVDHLDFTKHHGLYSCEATNSEGVGKSPDFFLDISYAPVCRHARDFGVRLNETISMMCDVDARPSLVYFQWYFNGTILNRYKYITRGSKSVVTYTPRTLDDYGLFECEARNTVGNIQQPCTYRIYPKDKPNPIKNCVVSQFDDQDYFIKCDYGFNGGLRSYCALELKRYNDSAFIMNMTNNENMSNYENICLFYPLNFTLNRIRLNVYSYNEIGWTEPYRFAMNIDDPTTPPVLLNLLGVTEESSRHEDFSNINISIQNYDYGLKRNIHFDLVEYARRFFRYAMDTGSFLIDRLFKRGNWMFLIIFAILLLMVICAMKFAANEPEDIVGNLNGHTISPIHIYQPAPFYPNPPPNALDHSVLDCHEQCEEFAWGNLARMPPVHYQADLDHDRLHQFQHHDHHQHYVVNERVGRHPQPPLPPIPTQQQQQQQRQPLVQQSPRFQNQLAMIDVGTDPPSESSIINMGAGLGGGVRGVRGGGGGGGVGRGGGCAQRPIQPEQEPAQRPAVRRVHFGPVNVFGNVDPSEQNGSPLNQFCDNPRPSHHRQLNGSHQPVENPPPIPPRPLHYHRPANQRPLYRMQNRGEDFVCIPIDDACNHDGPN